MKKIIVATVVAASMFTLQATAQEEEPEPAPVPKQQREYKSAVGLRLSSSPAVVNNSISFRYFFKENHAIEALISLGDPIAFGALYQIHNPLAVEGLNWFYGAGAYLGFEKYYHTTKNKDVTEPNVGAQGVVGLDYKFTGIPLNLSLDWKPELNLVREVFFEPAAIGVSARFTF
jgi:hypothetical protein